MSQNKTILFVSHDVNRAGAQQFILDIMLEFKKAHTVILLAKTSYGTLKDEFEKNFEVFYADQKYRSLAVKSITALEKIKSSHDVNLIYLNTIACCDYLPTLSETFAAPIISHIHELSYSIRQFGAQNALELLFKYSHKIIACSEAVKLNLLKYNSTYQIDLVHSFVNNQNILSRALNTNKEDVSERFDFNEQNIKIVACGNADYRKGPDLFLQIAKKTLEKSQNVEFIWIGIPADAEWSNNLHFDLEKLGLQKSVKLIPPTPEAVEIIQTSDIFLLCSREDPFPLVMLEAALCGKPIVGFKNSGGASEFIENDAGILCEYLDCEQVSDALICLTQDKELRRKLGDNGKEKVQNLYSFHQSFNKIKALIEG